MVSQVWCPLAQWTILMGGTICSRQTGHSGAAGWFLDVTFSDLINSPFFSCFDTFFCLDIISANSASLLLSKRAKLSSFFCFSLLRNSLFSKVCIFSFAWFSLICLSILSLFSLLSLSTLFWLSPLSSFIF